MKKTITSDQAQVRIKARCKGLGILYFENQKSKGEAAVRFINSPKMKKP